MSKIKANKFEQIKINPLLNRGGVLLAVALTKIELKIR